MSDLWTALEKFTEAANRLHEAAERVRAAMDDKLPCDVHLPPATYIGKGCSYRTLRTAIEQRKGYPDEMTTLPRPKPPSA